MRTERTKFLGLGFDRLAFRAVTRRLALVTEATPYGYIVTPNVDHVVRLHASPELLPIYRSAALCLCDSRILQRLAKLGGVRLPVVAGSDLTKALITTVIRTGDRVAIVGATGNLVESLRLTKPGVTFLHHEPPMGLVNDVAAQRAAAEFIAESRARFIFLAVGSPQQELIAHTALSHPEATGVAFCIGASLEFLTGEQKRAPRLLQLCGLEWAHRLALNPRRLWRRYLVDGMRIFPIFLRSRESRRLRIFLFVVFAALIAATALLALSSSYQSRSDGKTGLPVVPLNSRSAMSAVQVALSPPDLLRPLSAEEATKQNAERAFVRRPDEAAARFIVKPDSPGRLNAVHCLTQAIYYEAASEGLNGGRAVAQVVLNRVRHPGYPASVCGVVYQGSERLTGCQFSFTCDGSLLHTPNPAIWRRSLKVADEALAGRVFAPVGHATYYHADYVLPYWADSLDKTIQVGHHIFYRLRGSLGDSRMFHQAYASMETLPMAASATTPSASTAQQAAPSPSNLVADSQPVTDGKYGPSQATLKPIVDLSRGTLIADDNEPVGRLKRPKPLSDCAAVKAEEMQLRALGANEIRTGGPSSGC